MPPQNPRGVSSDDGARGRVGGYDCARTDDCAFPNRDAAKNRGATPNTRPTFHDRWHDRPVSLSLQCAALRCRARVFVIDKSDPMTNEHLVLDVDAFANEAMTRDLAIAADSRALLNLDERTDLRVVADFAAVKVDEVIDNHVPPELDIWRDDAELSRHALKDDEKPAVTYWRLWRYA